MFCSHAGATITLSPIDVITETDEDVNITVSFSVMGTFERPSTVTVSLTQSDVSQSGISESITIVAITIAYKAACDYITVRLYTCMIKVRYYHSNHASVTSCASLQI